MLLLTVFYILFAAYFVAAADSLKSNTDRFIAQLLVWLVITTSFLSLSWDYIPWVVISYCAECIIIRRMEIWKK